MLTMHNDLRDFLTWRSWFHWLSSPPSAQPTRIQYPEHQTSWKRDDTQHDLGRPQCPAVTKTENRDREGWQCTNCSPTILLHTVVLHGLTELCKQVHHSLHTATSSQCLHQNRAQCLQPTIPHHAYYLNATCYRQFGCCNHTSFSSSCAARQSAILLAVIEALVSRTTTELPACSTAARMQLKHSWTIEWA